MLFINLMQMNTFISAMFRGLISPRLPNALTMGDNPDDVGKVNQAVQQNRRRASRPTAGSTSRIPPGGKFTVNVFHSTHKWRTTKCVELIGHTPLTSSQPSHP